MWTLLCPLKRANPTRFPVAQRPSFLRHKLQLHTARQMGHDQFCKVSARNTLIHARRVYLLKRQPRGGASLTGGSEMFCEWKRVISLWWKVRGKVKVQIWGQLLPQTLVFKKKQNTSLFSFTQIKLQLLAHPHHVMMSVLSRFIFFSSDVRTCGKDCEKCGFLLLSELESNILPFKWFHLLHYMTSFSPRSCLHGDRTFVIAAKLWNS